MAKPFLRWAGGKNWLIKYLREELKDFAPKNYHEPFLGGGSVFFNFQFKPAYLSDLNQNLINCYSQVAENVIKVIEILETFENSKEFYYNLRDSKAKSDIERAAKFIYLNQTSFNGIYRVNLNGKYNVPYGFRTKDFIQREVLLSASKALENTTLRDCQFWETINNVSEGDLVFLDPPYTITHNNNGFIKYNEKLFKESDQVKLAEFIKEIIDLGAYYILTNAAHKRIEEIFHFNKPIPLSRASLIGGKNAQRGKYQEYLFTNIDHVIHKSI